MRTMIKLTAFLCFIALLGIISCSDEAENAELSVAAKQYLSMRMGSNNAMSQNMSGPINQSFQSLFNRSGGPNGRMAGDSSEIPQDSTGVPSDTTIIRENPWQSCAVVTEVDNEDGSHTTTHDYGDGCEEGWEGYKYFMHGKLTSTYQNLFSQIGSLFKNSYFYASHYDNYGGNHNGEWSWVLNGGGTYEGESEYDTANQTFSGNYSYGDELTYQYDSISYSYNGNSNVHYDESKYVVESSNYEYAVGEDYYYKANVLKPLVSDYTCYQQNSLIESFCYFWVYVSGRERIEFKDGDVTGVFEIDYGNGECDNIITIYENGNKTVIDLNNSWLTDGVATGG